MATTLANAETTTGAKTARVLQPGIKTFQAYGTTSSGTGAVAVKVEGSIDGTAWDSLGTLSLTLGTTVTSDGFTTNDAYSKHRANVTSISGTGAAVTVVTGA
jgi:hypothetical protein